MANVYVIKNSEEKYYTYHTTVNFLWEASMWKSKEAAELVCNQLNSQDNLFPKSDFRVIEIEVREIKDN